MNGNEKFMQIQHQIRQNSESVQEYVTDLTDWTSQINEKDRDVKQGKGVRTTKKKLPPIRSQKLENDRVKVNKSASYLDTISKKEEKTPVKGEEVKPAEGNDKLKRDTTPMPDYYKNWDNFDEKEALKRVEDEIAAKIPAEYHGLTEEEIKEKEKEKFLKGTSGAKPNTQIVIKGGNAPTPQLNIEHMKKQGNSFFSSLEFEKAIECYTKCLRMNPEDIKMKVVVYSNRSQ